MNNQGNASLERNIQKLYLMNFLTNAQFHLVVYTVFLLSKGFSTTQFFLIESAFALVALLMEIPTGVLSDKKTRKGSLIIASLIGIPVVPVIIHSDSFILVLIAMSIGGISSAFVSGTDVAILYDTLKALGREAEFKRIMGKMSWHTSVSMALAGIIGGLLAQLDMAYAWWAYFFAGMLALPVIIALQEPPFFKQPRETDSYLWHVRRSLKLSLSGDASYFIFYAAVIWLFFSIGFWLWQPYLKLTSMPVAAFGFVYAAANIIGGYVSKQAHRIEGKLGIGKSLLFTPLLLTLAFVLESQFVFILGFLFIFIHSVASGYFTPLLEDYVNSRIPSSKRATVLSIKNMLNKVLFMAFSPLVGHLVDRGSLTTALFLMGAVAAATSLVFSAVFRYRSVRQAPTGG